MFLQPIKQPADVFFTNYRYYRLTSRLSLLNNHYGNNARTCFMCKKRNYWSIRHTKEEHNKTKEGFKRRVH